MFVSEDITLAQIVRLVQLAKSLSNDLYEVHFACSNFKDLIFKGTSFIQWYLPNIGQERVQKSLDESSSIYTEEILESYLKDDLILIEKVKPDLIIGDLRLSLTISAPLSDIPFAVLINAYWSPFTMLENFPIPDHPMVQILGESMANYFFNLARPVAFAQFAKPVNTLRKKYGLVSIGSLLQTLTFGDYTLYPDSQELVPTFNLPSNHRYLGPVIWSPEGELRLDVNSVKERPVVYVTLGSSGKSDLLPKIIESLGKLPVFALVATAGRVQISELPENILLEEYLPGSTAASKSDLVICNGGSTTAYQGLNEGVPILGIATNIDQFLSMNYILKVGACELLRAGNFNARDFEQRIMTMLENPKYKIAAVKIKEEFSQYDYKKSFNDFVEGVLKNKKTYVPVISDTEQN